MQYTFTYQGSAEKFVSSLIYEIKGNIQDTYGSYSINEPNDGKEYTLSKHIPDIKRIGNGYPRELVWNASIKTYGELQPDVLSDGTIIMLPEILTATYPTAVTFKLKQSLDGTTTIVTSTYHSDVWKPFFEWLLQQCGESIWEPQAEQPANATSQQTPIPNQNGATWDDFFDWYYRNGILTYPDVKQLVNAIPLALGTINNNHSLYVQQYGRKPRPTE